MMTESAWMMLYGWICILGAAVQAFVLGSGETRISLTLLMAVVLFVGSSILAKIE